MATHLYILLIMTQNLLLWQLHNCDYTSPMLPYLKRLKFPERGAKIITGGAAEFQDRLDQNLQPDVENSTEFVTSSVVLFNIQHHHFDDNLILNSSSAAFKSIIKHLWITQEQVQQSSSIYSFKIINKDNMILKSLHISNLFVSNEENFSFLSQMPHLRVLDLKGPFVFNIHTASNSNSSIIDFLCKVTKALTGITSLEMLSVDRFQGYGLRRSGVVNITELLWPLRNSELRYLALKNLDIDVITQGIYLSAPKLKVLDVSENNFVEQFASVSFLIESALHPSLQVLKVGGINRHNAQPASQGEFHIKECHKVQSLAKAKRSEDNSFTSCMREKELTINELLSNKSAACSMWNCLLTKDHRPALTNGVPCTVIDIPNWMGRGLKLDSECESGFYLPIGENLTEIIADNVNIPFLSNYRYHTRDNLQPRPTCLISNNLKAFRFTNMFNTDVILSFIESSRFKGLESVEDISLSNGLYTFNNSDKMLSNFPNLRNVNLQRNSLVFHDDVTLCNGSRLVRNLDLSATFLKDIPPSVFMDCSDLVSLHLGHNQITNVNFSIASSFLQFIDLSGNPIRYISNKFQNELIAQSNALKVSKNQTIEIDFSGVVFTCGCSEIETIKWIKESHCTKQINFIGYEEYVCRYKLKNVKVSEVDLKQLNYECSGIKQILVITFANIIFIILIILMLIVYKFRYRIFIKYIWLKRTLLKKNRKGDMVKTQYDAYICYCSKDRFWVHGAMLPQLEDKYAFKLCIRYRDFLLGGWIAETILENMEESETIIIVLSENSLSKEWFLFEVQKAYEYHIRDGKNIVIIKLGSIQRSLMKSEYLLQILDSKSFMQWPDRKKQHLTTYNSESMLQASVDERPQSSNDMAVDGANTISDKVYNDDEDEELIQLTSKDTPNQKQSMKSLRKRHKKDKVPVETTRQEAFWAKIANQLYGKTSLC